MTTMREINEFCFRWDNPPKITRALWFELAPLVSFILRAKPICDSSMRLACFVNIDQLDRITRKRHSMKSQHDLKQAGKALRDRLAVTGENPILLAKLNALVDAVHLQAGDEAKLRKLLGEPL